MTKEAIFNKLNTCNFIVKNKYFEEYLKLVNVEYLGNNYKEAHHIFCKSFSKFMNEQPIDDKSNLVFLEFKDHCKAHWLLYKCTTGTINAAMANAFLSMIAFKYSSTLLDLGLTEQEYLELQANAELVRADPNLNYWKPEEIKFLLENYPSKGQRFCAEKLNKSLTATSAKANQLGLVMTKWWTDEEDLFLRDKYLVLGPKKCAECLNRTYGSTVSEAARLGLTTVATYTDEEVEFLKLNYAVYGQNYCAKQLNRTPAAIKRKARTLGLSCKQGMPIYCPEADMTFSSIKAASEYLHISDGNICSVLHGRLDSTSGYHFIRVSRGDFYEKGTY